METLNLDENHFIYGKDYKNQEKRAVCKTPTVLIFDPNQYCRDKSFSEIEENANSEKSLFLDKSGSLKTSFV